jgi:hypothetical protein
MSSNLGVHSTPHSMRNQQNNLRNSQNILRNLQNNLRNPPPPQLKFSEAAGNTQP